MARSTLLGGAMNFAHLLGGGRPAPAAGKPSAESEKDEDDKKKRDDDKDASAAASKVSDDEKDDDEDEKKRKKDDDDKDAKAGARRERARCAAIFASPHAATRPDMAAFFAFGTDMPQGEALNALAAVAAGHPAPAPAAAAAPPARSGLAARMEGQKSPDLGESPAAAPSADTPQGLALQMLASAGLTAK